MGNSGKKVRNSLLEGFGIENFRRLFSLPLLGFVGISIGGCASAPSGSQSEGPSIVATTSATFKGDTFKNIRPLPNSTPVTFRQFYSDGHHEDRPGFVEYDFNKDGFVDMLEVTGKDGRPETYVYDFDFDGKIDAHERVGEDSNQKKSHSPK